MHFYGGVGGGDEYVVKEEEEEKARLVAKGIFTAAREERRVWDSSNSIVRKV